MSDHSTVWTEIQSRIVYKPSKKSRSLRISIHSAEKVLVSFPHRTSQRQVQHFVEEHKEWLIIHFQEIHQRRNTLGIQTNQLLLYGEVKNIVLDFTHTKPVGVQLQGDSLLINPVSKTTRSINAALTRFLRQEIAQYITEHCHLFSQQMNIVFNKITFRNQSTRWGSCSSQGNLNFNEKLIHAPPAVINYVIIHELAHRKHMNHSPQFWRLVEQFDPNYRLHRGWLKRHGTHASFIELNESENQV